MTNEILNKLPPDFFQRLGAPDNAPADLREQLLGDTLTQTHEFILGLLQQADRLSLDKIVEGLWHLSGTVYKRTAVSGHLNRLAKRGLVFPVPGKRWELAEKGFLRIGNKS